MIPLVKVIENRRRFNLEEQLIPADSNSSLMRGGKLEQQQPQKRCRHAAAMAVQVGALRGGSRAHKTAPFVSSQCRSWLGALMSIRTATQQQGSCEVDIAAAMTTQLQRRRYSSTLNTSRQRRSSAVWLDVSEIPRGCRRRAASDSKGSQA